MFKVSLKHTFEHQDGIFTGRGFECLCELAKEDAIKRAKCGLFSSNEEAWNLFSWPSVFGSAQQIRGFLLNEGYLKTVKVETDDECETEKRGGQASTSA